jgi:hypothetical protein
MFYTIGDNVLARCKNIVGPSRKFLLYDGHGSVRQLTGILGLENESYCYDGYGVLLQTEATSSANPGKLFFGFSKSGVDRLKVPD